MGYSETNVRNKRWREIFERLEKLDANEDE